jgi:hypothetical protein
MRRSIAPLQQGDKMNLTATTTIVQEPKGKKVAPVQIEMGSDLTSFAACTTLIKSLKLAADVFEVKVKDRMTTLFTSMGLEAGKRPANFTGIADFATASCQLKQRSSASALNTEDATFLRSKGITVNETVVQEAGTMINPEVLANPALKAKIEAALSLIDFGGVDPIVLQPKVIKFTVADESLDQVFGLAAEEVAQTLPMVSTLAVSPKFNGSFMDAAKMVDATGRVAV